jgi:ABC-type polysaccharide/polyol phosphate export permease
MTATRLDDDFTSSVHVYEPHRAGFPRFGPYLRELWRRRAFATELSRTTMRAANTTTVFGQLWLVINPLLLAVVYFILVTILRTDDGEAGDFFAHLVAGLFAFYFVSGAITTGAASVVGGGKLLLNTSFPRLLLPLSAVRTAFGRFLPTLIVYIPIHLAVGLPLRWTMLLALFFLAMMGVFATGMAMIFATAQVYFRDTASFLPYFTRIWLYLSPILWYPVQVPTALKDFMVLNPLYPMIGGWSKLLVRGEVPQLSWWIAGTVWALVSLVVGALLFMSREREFAVRL